jgi:succinate-semialdehyde dehydrogenase/glutarate-semialdehyde dehydrogenase
MLRAIDVAFAGKKEWAKVPQYKRSAMLVKAADLIEAKVNEIGRLLATEMGKVITQTTGEVSVVPQIIRGYAEVANHLYSDVMSHSQVGSETDIIFTRREPIGVIGAITPFNYPVELCYHKVAAAIASGNVIIVKPADSNPLSIIKMAESFMEAGFPAYVLQVVTGPGSVLGQVLAESPKVNGISFTGSTEVGLKLAKTASGTLKRVGLELGGNDPFIVFEDASLELAVREAVDGRIKNAGQTCCAPKRFIVHSSVIEEFTAKAIEGMKNVKAGCPLDPATEMGSLISPKAAEETEKQVEHTVKQGAKLVLGGKRYDETYFEPTVLTGVTKDMDIARDMEVFGPVMPIIKFDSFDEAIEIANNSMYGLNAGVITKDSRKAIKTASLLENGVVVINGSGNYRNIDQPHGGVKMSGVGKEGLCCTIQDMTDVKSYVLKNILA